MAVKFSTEFDFNKLFKNFISKDELIGIQNDVNKAVTTIKEKNGPGNEFLGWVDLPEYYNYNDPEYKRIKVAAEKIKIKCDILIVIGIGGSYLGAKAAIEFIRSPLYNNLIKNTPDIYFAGNNINTAALTELLEICRGKDICVNVISKSGKTTEPALAFRIFRKYIEEKYGEAEARERIFVTTDKEKGVLKKSAELNGYETFVVPDDIGGRYSVLSAVGLLPVAVAGIDIDEIMSGAKKARTAFYCGKNDIGSNDCYKYAAVRNILYRKGKFIEIMVSYDNALIMTSEWWKQLYGESEGKNGKGVFPASVTYTTDLHSLGQIIQEGERNIFETVLNVKNIGINVEIPYDEQDSDDLNYIIDNKMNLHDINQCALKATVIAHTDGNVPNIVLDIDRRDAENFGYLIYFFELACAVSGYILGVNPFDQTGVENYKDNMFALLGKKGDKFELIRKNINEKY